MAEQALAAGKPVVCEKPLATTVEDARRLTTSAGRLALVATVPFVYRFYATVREARARIAAGEAGPLRLLHGTYLQDWLSKPEDSNWRVDPQLGGASRAFGDIGVHWCDLMEFVTGHRITRLIARMRPCSTAARRSPARPQSAPRMPRPCLFETDQGACGAVVISQISPGRKNRLWFSFDGAEACYSFDQENPDSLWIGGRASNQILLRGAEGHLGGRRARTRCCRPGTHRATRTASTPSSPTPIPPSPEGSPTGSRPSPTACGRRS